MSYTDKGPAPEDLRRPEPVHVPPARGDVFFRMLDGPPLPRAVAEALYEHVYRPVFGDAQSLREIELRGGFAYSEIKILASALLKIGKQG